MQLKETVAQLSKVPIFLGCARRELELIARAAKELHHKPGSVISREGDPGIGLFIILEGTATVTIGGVRRGTMGPGDFFGEVALLDRGPRTATVTATTPLTLLVLTEWVFRGLVLEHPSIGVRVLQGMAARLRNASKLAPV
jgi:CRP/FNR family transcriptional regulator, cyclic AMP receptor protein